MQRDFVKNNFLNLTFSYFTKFPPNLVINKKDFCKKIPQLLTVFFI